MSNIFKKINNGETGVNEGWTVKTIIVVLFMFGILVGVLIALH